MPMNSLPVGAPLPGWTPPAPPARSVLQGRLCRLEPLDTARHAAELFDAYAGSDAAAGWTYLAYGPFADAAEFTRWVEAMRGPADPLMFAVVDRADGRACGMTAFLRIAAAAGSIEIGHLHFAPRLQRTPMATEALFLMMREAFALGYRRLEWKCDSLNQPSRRAAQRLGFCFEGVFRQALVVKGRNRDTAWFSIIDGEWPALREAFERWLDPDNFDARGVQRSSLAASTAAVRAALAQGGCA